MDLYNYDWRHQRFWSLKQYPPRPEQKQIIDEIIEAIEMGFKNIILEAGTGTGKSAIATTSISWHSPATIFFAWPDPILPTPIIPNLTFSISILTFSFENFF